MLRNTYRMFLNSMQNTGAKVSVFFLPVLLILTVWETYQYATGDAPQPYNSEALLRDHQSAPDAAPVHPVDLEENVVLGQASEMADPAFVADIHADTIMIDDVDQFVDNVEYSFIGQFVRKINEYQIHGRTNEVYEIQVLREVHPRLEGTIVARWEIPDKHWFEREIGKDFRFYISHDLLTGEYIVETFGIVLWPDAEE